MLFQISYIIIILLDNRKVHFGKETKIKLDKINLMGKN